MINIPPCLSFACCYKLTISRGNWEDIPLRPAPNSQPDLDGFIWSTTSDFKEEVGSNWKSDNGLKGSRNLELGRSSYHSPGTSQAPEFLWRVQKAYIRWPTGTYGLYVCILMNINFYR